MVELSTDEKQRLEEERMMKETMENREQKWLEMEKAYKEKKLQETEKA